MEQKAEKVPRCAEYKIERTICRYEDGKGPAYCPTINFSDVVKASLSEYENPEIRNFALNATIQER